MVITVKNQVKIPLHQYFPEGKKGRFLANHIWRGNNFLAIILSGFIEDNSFFWRFLESDKTDEKFESKRNFSIHQFLDWPQRLVSNHCVVSIDLNNSRVNNSKMITSTKNISILGDMTISGGKSIDAITVRDDYIIEKWSKNLSEDFGVIIPVIGKDSLFTVIFSTEWVSLNEYCSPNPSIDELQLISISESNGEITHKFSIPYQYDVPIYTHSNICIGDIYYLDYGRFIVAINMKNGKILWESESLIPINGEIHPLFFYSSSIVPDSYNLYYCLGGRIIGIDRMSGNIIWDYSLPEMPDEYYTGSEMRITVYEDNIVIVGLTEVQSINKNSGELIWTYKGTDADLINFTSTPVLNNGNIVLGMSTFECDWNPDGNLYSSTDYLIGINCSSGEEQFIEEINFRISGNLSFSDNLFSCLCEDILFQFSIDK